MRTVTLAGLGVVLVVAIGCGSAPRNDGSGPAPIRPLVTGAAAPGSPASGDDEATTTAPATPPADVVYRGSGDKVLKIKLTGGFLHIAAITHTGRSNFVVKSLDSGGGHIDLLVNEIGNYTGVRPLDFDEKPVALEINADGKWKLTIKAAQTAPVWTGNSSGKGDAVLLVHPDAVADGLVTVKITHKGSSNFIVKSYGDGRDLLINEIGNYSGEVLLPAGTVLLEIVADGGWTAQMS